MKLLTNELLKRFEEVGSQEEVDTGDKIIIAKYFNPTGAGTWYATEYDPENKEFFGFVTMGMIDDQDAEWGYFSLAELEGYVGAFGLGIERDLHFGEKKFSEVRQ